MAMTGHLHEPTMLQYLRVSGKAQERAQGGSKRIDANRPRKGEGEQGHAASRPAWCVTACSMHTAALRGATRQRKWLMRKGGLEPGPNPRNRAGVVDVAVGRRVRNGAVGRRPVHPATRRPGAAAQLVEPRGEPREEDAVRARR